MKKKIFYISSLVILLFFAVTLYCNDFSYIYSIPNGFYANLEELNEGNSSSKFGKFVSLDIANETSVSDKNYKERIVVFKLFGFIPIRKIVAKVLPEEEVYVGGNPVGISITFDKAIVVSKSEFGKNFIALNIFKEGDVISKINGEEIGSLDELEEKLLNCKDSNIEMEIYRNDKPIIVKAELHENEEGKQKIGLTVKDGVSGIGTLTYINSKTGQFGALGHELCDNIEKLNIVEGNLYECTMLGIEKGKINNPGQLRCVFVTGKNDVGEIDNSNKFGIYGTIKDFEDIIDPNLTLKLGGRLSVSPGKAKIISSISGIREEYEIEIIKTFSQNTIKNKSFIFRVTDRKLLELTGGIVQGMSGSPIIQNDKIVGAVTHVFTADPTKGYGLYTDWMQESN